MDKKLLEQRKKMLQQLMQDDLYVPMKAKELAVFFGLAHEEKKELQQCLDELEAEGKIERSKRGKYTIATEKQIIGVFTGHPRGFGFVTLEGEAEDIFIPEKEKNGAFHMDTVQITISKSPTGKRREGKVVKILSHGLTEVVGTFEQNKNFGFVIPDNQKIDQDLFIAKEHTKGAIDGHKVVVQITNYGKPGKKPEGKVVEILGHENDPGTDIMSIVRAYGLPVEFSEKIMHQVENVSNEVSTADMAGRMDLRDWQMITIDGEDAKDLDDAVSLTMDGEIYVLGVHIADVSNYVQEHSALDVEALKRGTSVYLVDRVIPMLPHKLSNGICSLNAGENRLTLSCIMRIDQKGNIIDHKIGESVINVNERMSYTGVKKILEDHDPQLCERYAKIVPMLEKMQELAAILRKKRMQRGSIDFDFPETKIKVDENGKPIEILPYERNVATKMIEDFMLAANETVAEDCFWQELPFVYRSHDWPDEDKIYKLATFIRNFGYDMHVGQNGIHPKDLQKLLTKVEGTKEEALISRLTLRSMKQAKYTTQSEGHFGLASSYYCHFTSPIRRYPDLQIHRIIKDNLRGRMNEKRRKHYEEILPEVAKHSSEMERRADETERETNKLKKAEYMEQYLGQSFTGVISGITNWGIYVELPNTVEGMIPVQSLTDDFYNYQESTYELVGEHSGRRFKLGEQVSVVPVRCDRQLRTIDFMLKEEDEDGERTDEADRE
ncbi:MAG: ribonuclease R [Lachnospiraceae bacterium]